MTFLKQLRTLLAIVTFCHLIPVATAQINDEGVAFKFAEQYYFAGRAAKNSYDKGTYLNYAMGLYVNYLNTYPNSKNAPAARFHLGHARQEMGFVEQSKKTYKTVIERHRTGPYVGSAARQLAYLGYIEEDWEEAATYFGIAAKNLTQENLRQVALENQIKMLRKLGRTEDLVLLYRQIMDSPNHPKMNWARFNLGYIYYEREEYETVIQVFAPLLAPEAPGDYRSDALFYTGLASAELGRDDDAESYLRTILTMRLDDPSLDEGQRKHLRPNKARAQTALMGLYTKKEDYEEVIKLYELGDFGASGKVEARRSGRAGRAYLNLKSFQRARSCFQKVDMEVPNTQDAFEASFKVILCDYYLRSPGVGERVDTFFSYYKKDNSKDPRFDMALFLKGLTLFNNKAYERAAVVFAKIDEEDIQEGFRAELLFKRGWCQSKAGQNDGAIKSFGHFLANHPDDPRRAEALNMRGEAHFALGDRTSALRDFEEVLSPDTTASAEQISFALQRSGQVLREEKKYQSMIARYQRLLNDYPTLPRDTVANAKYWIGWGYYQLDDYDQVPKYLREARELGPEFYTQPVGNLLILTAFAQRDKEALHVALQEVFKVAPAKEIPPHMLSWLGVQMFHDVRIKEAVSYLERATNIDYPKRTEVGVWRILAKAQNRIGRYEAARQTGELLLGLEQEDRWQADAYLDLAEAQLGLGNYSEALESANKGLGIDTKGAHLAGLHLVQADVALHQERWPEALDEYKVTIGMVPDDPVMQPRALYGAIDAARKVGEDALARDYTSQLKNRFPEWKPRAKPRKRAAVSENK